MNKIIPYGKQSIDQEDIQAVIETLQSDFLTQGPKVLEFEEKFAKYVNAKYAVAVANGTAALHLGALALGVQKGDYVIVTSLTFAASVNSIKYCGGEVIFADIDPKTYLIDINHVERILLENSTKRIVGIIPVDFAGRVVDTERLKQIAQQYHCWIMEDACHAPGGYFLNQSQEKILAGSCHYSDLAIFSFHPVKHIACGEGGMITTNDEKIYHHLLKLRTHGITRNQSEFVNPTELADANAQDDAYPMWYMEMQELGYNYRMPDVLCALGISQLTKAAEGLAKRRTIAKKYDKVFQGQPNLKGASGVIEGHAYHLYILEIENRKKVYDFLRTKGIFSQIHYFPVHLMPYYQSLGWKKGDLPHTENYYQHCISIPMYPSISEEELNYTIEQIKSIL